MGGKYCLLRIIFQYVKNVPRRTVVSVLCGTLLVASLTSFVVAVELQHLLTLLLARAPTTFQYTYIINNEKICDNNEPIVAIMLVDSHLQNFLLREQMRQAFTAEELLEAHIVRVFVLGILYFGDNFEEENVSQRAFNQYPSHARTLREERVLYGDIVQTDVVDRYDYQVLKTMMALEWAVRYCEEATFIIKTSDNVIFNMIETVNTLRNLSESGDIDGKIIGNVINAPARDWMRPFNSYTLYNSYGFQSIPKFVNHLVYVMQPKTADLILSTAKSTSFFRLENVFLTGVVAKKAGVQLYDLKVLFERVHEYGFQCCKNETAIFQYLYTVGSSFIVSDNRQKALMKTCYADSSCVPCDIQQNTFKIAIEDHFYSAFNNAVGVNPVTCFETK